MLNQVLDQVVTNVVVTYHTKYNGVTVQADVDQRQIDDLEEKLVDYLTGHFMITDDLRFCGDQLSDQVVRECTKIVEELLGQSNTLFLLDHMSS